MEEPKRKGGRPRGVEFPHVFSYLDGEGLALLDALAERRGLSKAALARVLIRGLASRRARKPS